MKSLKIALLSLALAVPAFAQQPQEFGLKVTADELNVISEALTKEPFAKVVNLIGKLRQQVIEQQTPKAVVSPAKQEEPAAK